jgi:autophagy-related protein 101
LRVKFFEQREKAGWFSKTIENICWEEWYLPVRLAGDAGNNKVAEVRTKTAAQLEACLNQIVEAANDPRPYFPKLVSKDMVPFPYTVEVVPPNDNELLNFWSIIAATK